MEKQVDKSHYNFSRYVDKQRWTSMWHQVDEVYRLKPKRVLEIGPGPGVFKAVSKLFGLAVETLDIDPDLGPDHVASVFEMPFKDGAFDVVCAFQMLEHLPFEKSLEAFREMSRVAQRAIVISLPNAERRWPFSVHIPRVGLIQRSVPKPRLKPIPNTFEGEHYWEINKEGYALRRVEREFLNQTNFKLSRSYRVPEHLYHHFFVFESTSH